MEFKKRLLELENNKDTVPQAMGGAKLCYETLKTCKAILVDVMGDSSFVSIKDILELYPKLVGCEIEVAMQELKQNMSSVTSNEALGQMLLNRKKINDMS